MRCGDRRYRNLDRHAGLAPCRCPVRQTPKSSSLWLLAIMTKLKFSDEEVRHAVRWFYRQPEGQPFFDALQSILEEIAGPQDASALHRHDERRKFAADLIAMAEAEKRD